MVRTPEILFDKSFFFIQSLVLFVDLHTLISPFHFYFLSKMMPSKRDKDRFLPDFCHVYTIFLIVIMAELLAFILVLAPVSQNGYGLAYIKEEFLPNLAMVSLFIQWVTLVSLWLLCLVRRQLCQLESDRIIGIVSFLLILIVTFAVSDLAYELQEYMSSVEPRGRIVHRQFQLKYFVISAIVSLVILFFFYHYQFIKKDIAVLSYVIILMATLILTDWISFLQTEPSLSHDALKHQWFVWRNMGISALVNAIALRYFYIQYHWKKEIEAVAHARAQALQARIRPHFLFNSMNSIASLIRFQADKAEQAVLDFADLFRASLVDIKTTVTFQEEFTLCQQYLNIEALRLGERLQVVWEIDKIPFDALLPPLSLQPLLENAVYHGIQPLTEGGTISITGQFDGKSIKLTIQNPLKDSHFSHQGHHIAQDNIRQRLQVFYGSLAKLNIQKEEANWYQVNLIIPYRNQSF
jgi:two-component system sensor histidine kinase AlgZ